jgi:hypothetical protein
MEHIICKTMMDSVALRELNLELQLLGNWASCALMRIIGVGLTDHLHTFRLRMRCKEPTIHAAQQIAITIMHNRWTTFNRLSTLELDLTSTDLDTSTGRFLVHALRHLPVLQRLLLNVSCNTLIGNSTLFGRDPEWERSPLPSTTTPDRLSSLKHVALVLGQCGIGPEGCRRWLCTLSDERLCPFPGLQRLSLNFAGNHIGRKFNCKTLPMAFCPSVTRRLCINVTDNQFTETGKDELVQWLGYVRKQNPTIDFSICQ